MAKIYDQSIDKNIPWDGNEVTGYLPVKGTRVEEFIKDSLNRKMGCFYYDTTGNRYLVFADESSKEEYLSDTTKTDLILGTFDAPFNYEASISLVTPNFNAILLGNTGNYIEFTFDTTNKSGASVGEDVTCTYTITRGGSKKVITERYRYGSTIKFNVDPYLGEGTNNIIIGIVGVNTLAATTVGVTYQVVNLSLSTTYDISKVYNLSVDPNSVMEIPYSISGTGTKTIEWYLDGVQLDYEVDDEVVEVSTTRTKYINLAGLSQGSHNIQARAYVTINGENFYSNIIWLDAIVYTTVDRNPIIALSTTIPSEYGIITSGDLTLYGLEQYIPYTFQFSVYNPTGAASTEAIITVGDEINNSVLTYNNTVIDYTIRVNTYGVKELNISIGNPVVSTYTANLEVTKSSAAIEEDNNNLVLDLYALGRTNNDSNLDTWTSGIYSTTFTGFNWNNTSGWVNNRLVISGGASIEVDLAPFSERTVTSTGLTLEFEFATSNVNNEGAIICDLRNESGKGLLVTANEAKLISAGNSTVSTKFKSGENIRIAFVINPATGAINKGLMFIYIDGILSGATNYSENDNFLSDTLLKIGGTEEATVELKHIRIYNKALDGNGILNNYILYQDSSYDMMNIYDRNNILSGRELDLDILASQCPVLKITGDIPTLEGTTDKDETIYVDVEYVNMQDPTRSFTGTHLRMRPQGTSSMGYPKKNFRLYTNKDAESKIYDYTGKIIADRLYSFKEGAQPVDCWCFKADYAESSGTHNTGIARLWNKVMYNATVSLDLGTGNSHNVNNATVLRTNAQQTALDNNYPYDVRTTIDGFPCHIVYRLTETDDWVYIGKYNFNNDKSTESVFGFTFPDGVGMDDWNEQYKNTMQCWEVLNNGNHLALFEDTTNFDTEWQEAYEARYPDSGASADTTYLKNFCSWVVSTKNNVDKFSAEKWDHLDVYKAAAYYVYVMRFGAVDQLVKNSMLTTEDGQHFFWINYDNDTINGLRNDGLLAFDYLIDRESLDPNYDISPDPEHNASVYVYAGHNSTLWNNMEADEEFMKVVVAVDEALYQAGLKYTEVIDMFDNQQSAKWCERVYNQDAQYKYIGPWNDKGTNNLFMLQGARRAHRRWWLSHRFDLMDSKFISGKYKANIIDFKVMNDTPAGQQFTIKAGNLLYYGYGINDIPEETGVKLEPGDEYTFTTDNVLNIGDPVRIYSAQNIQKLDLSRLMTRLSQTINLEKAYDPETGTQLKELIIGNGTSVNTGLTGLSGLDQLRALELLDVRGCLGLSSVSLKNLKTLKTFKAQGSGLTSFNPAEGSVLTEVSLPSTITSMTLKSLPYLESINVENAGRNLSTIQMNDCPYLTENFSFFSTWYDNKITEDRLCTLELDNVNWTGLTPNELLKIGRLKTNGGLLKLKGRASITESSEEIVTELSEIFGSDCFDKGSEFYISAPDAIYLTGADSLLEGSSAQYTAAVFSDYQGKVEWSIISGGTGYQSIDQYGLLTTKYQGSARTITIQAKHYPTQGSVTTITKSVNITKQIRPTGGSISGNNIAGNGSVYNLTVTPSGINTDYSVTWSLSGTAYNEGSVSIDTQNKTECKLAVVGGRIGSFTITATITDCAGNVVTVTKNVELGIMVTIKLVSNQSGDTGLNDKYATYYLNGATSGSTVLNGKSISVPTGSSIKVVFPSVSGYTKPNDIEYVLGNESETLTGSYSTTYVYVNITDNQSGYNDISGCTASISASGMSTTTVKSGEYAKVPTGVNCTISFSTLSGYKKPDNITFTTSGTSVTKTGQYQTEILTVEVSAGDGDPLPDSYTITISGVGTQTTTAGTYKIPYGTTYTVSASPVEGYSEIKSQTYTAGVTSRVVSIVYVVYKIVDLGNEVDLSLLDIHGSSISRSTANCYVVRETGEYCFPLVYGNAIKNGATNTEAYTKVEGDYSHDFVNHLDNVITDPYIANNTDCVPYKAELSMVDTDGVFSNIAVANGGGILYIRFTVDSMPESGANGVISVLDADGVVMWSWHIWVWSDDLTPVTITNSTGVDYDILPVNLGSKWDSDSKDKIKNWYYQFGRPTPMLCPSAYNSTTDHTNYGTKTFTATSIASSIGQGLQNPQTFYKYGSSYNYNWFSTNSSKTYNLWDASCINTGTSDNTVIKTIYDPCPVGYHMPNGNTFTGFSKTNVVGSFANGYYFKKNSSDTTGVFFPASGFRYFSNGSLYYVGSYGFVWLSSAHSTNYAYYLSFYSSGVNPQDSNFRASGYSVRPVREEL